MRCQQKNANTLVWLAVALESRYATASLARQPHVVFDSAPACKVMCSQQEVATSGSSAGTRVAVLCDHKRLLECRSTASWEAMLFIYLSEQSAHWETSAC